MGDFSDGRNILLTPEPGRPIKPAPSVVKEPKIEQKDINAIADAVIKAIGDKIPKIIVNSQQEKIDDFDNSSSLDKLAKAMIVDRDAKESNLDGVGTIKETKKDTKTTDNMIDLLSKLGD